MISPRCCVRSNLPAATRLLDSLAGMPELTAAPCIELFLPGATQTLLLPAHRPGVFLSRRDEAKSVEG